jgi:hypothetical protein
MQAAIRSLRTCSSAAAALSDERRASSCSNALPAPVSNRVRAAFR